MANHPDIHKHSLHAVVVPYPVQSHIKALITFSELLLTRGFHFITFLNTEWTHKSIFGSTDYASGRANFRFLPFPDGLPTAHGRTRTTDLKEVLTALQHCGSFNLEMVFFTAVENLTIPPITCIISDPLMSCTHSVAASMGLPRVIFWPVCAAFSISQKYAHLLLSEGHIPVKDARSCSEIRSLPGNIPPLLPRDLYAMYPEQHEPGVEFKSLLYESEMVNKGVDYVLINTFEELEGRETAEALSVNGCPAVAVGPVFLPGFLRGGNESIESSLWEEDESCLKWLDMQPVDSVVYVSFGSSAVKSQQQLEEMALGLETSGQPFLWVLRPDLAEGESTALPEGFNQRTKERAVFVSWAPQLKVLSHPSVGGFLTHSGWNSTLESLSMGVPMLGWPHLFDQSLNCRFAKDVWKIGIDFSDWDVYDERLVGRDEVESAVRRLMQSEEGMKARKTSRKLKEAATEAVMAGGSSFENLEAFIKDMRQRTNECPRDPWL